ncbi:MAG: hypothetical protein RL685_4135 [Pseudomonadota bacterium]
MQVRFLWLVAVALLNACSQDTEDADPRLLMGPLTVDHEFLPEQRADILAAVNLWRRATGGRFAPEVHFADVSCGQPFAIEAVPSEGCHIGHEVHDDDDDEHDEHDDERLRLRVLGAAHPHQHWISVVTWLDGAAFRDNVAHELGHYVLLGHGQGVMAQARKREPAVVAPTSISEFCAIWGCDPPDATD